MKNKSIIIIGLTLLVIVAVSFFMIRPTAAAIWQSWREVSKSEAELKKVQDRNQAIKEIENNKDEINRVASIAEKYIPSNSESGDLILELSAIATGSNLKVEKTSLENNKNQATSTAASDTETKKTASPTPSPSASAGTVVSVQNVEFTMDLSGTFPDFLNFVKTIETSSRLIIIKNITMQMGQTAESGMKFQILGTAFYKQKVTLPNSLENIKVSQDTINNFLNLKTNAQPINLPAESGFGRANPFEGY